MTSVLWLYFTELGCGLNPVIHSEVNLWFA